jgi:membrane-associated phospholipid phosphatase
LTGLALRSLHSSSRLVLSQRPLTGGRTLYLTVAILVRRHLQRTGHQIAILAITVGIILLVGMTRIYLGVHYPSDVASGISLGADWALLLAGCFSLFPDLKIAPPGSGSLDRALPVAS